MNLKYLFAIACLFVATQISAQNQQPETVSYVTNLEECQPVCNENGSYISVFGGANWLDHIKNHDVVKMDYKVGGLAGIAAGYRFNRYTRFEAEFAYRRNELDKLIYEGVAHHPDSHIRTLSYMANTYIDFPVCSTLKPYVGAGLGYMDSDYKIRTETEHFQGSSSGLAAQLMAGVAVPVGLSTEVGVEYRYFIGRENFRDHSAVLTAKYMF